MDVITLPERAYDTALSLFKKGLALVIFHGARFLNTLLGKLCAIAILLCLIGASAYYADIILIPMLVSVFGALWRRVVFYVAVRRLSAKRRRSLRMHWHTLCGYLRRKWGQLSFWGRVACKFLFGVAAGMTLLHYLHIWSIAAYITAILPIPVFIEIYLGQKLPRMLASFVQRQGIGKLVFDGGWHLVPVDLRTGARRVDRLMTIFIKRTDRKSIDRAFERLERLKDLRRRRLEERQAENLQLEKELATLE